MYKFSYNDKEYNLATCWDDVTLGTWIRIMKEKEKNEILKSLDAYIDEDLQKQTFIEICAGVAIGEFDDMSIGDLHKLQMQMLDMFTIPTYDKTVVIPDHFDIDGIIYSYRKYTDEYTTGEVADIKRIIYNKKNEYDYILDSACIMIRPATKETSAAGVTYYKLVKRELYDMKKIKQVVNNLPLKYVMVVHNFFLSGLLDSMISTQMYLKETRPEIVEHLLSQRNTTG